MLRNPRKRERRHGFSILNTNIISIFAVQKLRSRSFRSEFFVGIAQKTAIDAMQHWKFSE